MTRLWLPRDFMLLLIVICCSTLEANKRNVKAIKNAEFQNKKLTEIPVEQGTVQSRMDCILKCMETLSCVSFSFNDDIKDCYLYNTDYVNITDTQTTDEIGWNYYYIVPVIAIDRSKCNLQSIGICKSFCFFSKNSFSSKTSQGFMTACADDGGEVIKVDRDLKQYCMAQAVDAVIGGGLMALSGMQNANTGEWTHFDGTKITYFNWDLEYVQPQPNYISAIATPGAYEGSIGTRKTYNYRWHDIPDWKVDLIMCEIK